MVVLLDSLELITIEWLPEWLENSEPNHSLHQSNSEYLIPVAEFDSVTVHSELAIADSALEVVAL